MNELATFQTSFLAALHDDDSAFAPAKQAAFAVYRNTVMRACLDALEANFPSLVCLVGREWFRAAGAIHVPLSPPRDVRLGNYGEAFADFLAAFEPAADLPYLADVARLDRLWTESLHAADVPILSVDALAALSPHDLAAVRPRIHPATRWLASSMPARSIWEASRAGVPVEESLAWLPEGALIVRAEHHVRVLPIVPGDIAMLEAIAGGASLAEAAETCALAHPGAPIDLIVSGLLRSGAFTPS